MIALLSTLNALLEGTGGCLSPPAVILFISHKSREVFFPQEPSKGKSLSINAHSVPRDHANERRSYLPLMGVIITEDVTPSLPHAPGYNAPNVCSHFTRCSLMSLFTVLSLARCHHPGSAD